MSLRIKALSAALGVAIASLAFNAIGCSTVIVGKDVSKTGTIIVGHNEDNGGRSLSAPDWGPAATPAQSEKI